MIQIRVFETLAYLGRQLTARVCVNQLALDPQDFVENVSVAEIALFQRSLLFFGQLSEQVARS
jgi:hypothetical protein